MRLAGAGRASQWPVMPVRTLVFAITAACAVLVAGCGERELTAQEYRQQGNAACQRYERAVRELDPPRTVRDVGRYAKAARTQLVALVDDFEQLRPPGDLKPRHDQLIAVGRRSENALAELGQAGETGRRTGVQRALVRASQLDRQGDELSRSLGLTRCADEA